MKLVLSNSSPLIEYYLSKKTTLVGSGPDCDVRLSHDNVFPRHALIWQSRGMFAINDVDAQGEVYVNGRHAIKSQPLWPGDTIALGDAQLAFLRDDAPLDDFASAPASDSQTSGPPSPAYQDTANELQKLAALDAATLEKLRRQSPALKPVSGLSAFLRQGLALTNTQQKKGIFGLLFTLPAIALTVYQAIRAKLFGASVEDAFPEGTWQFYTQFALREDSARHANETDGFHRAIPDSATGVDQAAAWTFQSITTLFEYASLLENEWVERTLLRLVHEAIADSVVEKLAAKRAGPDINVASEQFQVIKDVIWEKEIEQVEIETEQVKQNLELSNLEWTWIQKRPYRKPPGYPHETYPQFRRKVFLEFLVSVSERLPAQMGALIWDRYYELSAAALPAYQEQMSILYALKPERYQDKKTPIPLWQAKLGFIAGGRYYLINVAHHDPRGRLLVFKPGKPDDPGKALSLRQNDAGELVDQQGRRISVNHKGNVTITNAEGNSHIKTLRPTPASRIKAKMVEILREAQLLSPAAAGSDRRLVAVHRAEQPRLIGRWPQSVQAELEAFDHIPIIINWDERDRFDTLQAIRSAPRGIGNHALTIFRTESSFVFDQSHIFFDAIWGMVISQVITDGAIETYRLIAGLPPSASHIASLSPLQLQDGDTLSIVAEPPSNPEAAAETNTPNLRLINNARKTLRQVNVSATVNDLLTIYRGLHDQLYTPGLDLQRALTNLRFEGHSAIADQIETMWQIRKEAPVSLFLPMDASYIDPKLRLFPATYTNFLPDFAALYETTAALLEEQSYAPSPELAQTLCDNQELIIANLMVMSEYFKMLKRITRQGESISTAAIKYLAHLPPGMQGTLDLIPQHVGALNELLKGEEVFSNVGRVSPTSSLVRFASAKDDGQSKVMVWGIMTDSYGNLKITLRDFRPHVSQLFALGYEATAELIAQDYLEDYARKLNQFVENIAKIATMESN